MRILLVNPFYPIDETPSPPLGLSFIAAALEKNHHDIHMLDFVVYPYSDDILKRKLEKIKPDMVGVTSVTMSFNAGIDVVQKARQMYPAAVTVMGGPHVTFHAKETLDLYPELDCIVLGEGDQTVVELAEAVEKKKDWLNVAGIAYRGEGGEVVCTSPRKPVDVNALAVPARHFVPLGRYLALGMAISMTSSRGCPFKCIFCVGRKMVGAKVRYREAVAVVDELETLWSLGFHQINMADDLFTANKAHCHAVCDEILKRGLKVGWTSFARVDTVSEDVLVKMKEAGCHTISFGVESGNPEMLKRIRKGITLDQVIQAVGMCSRAGIVPHVSFIIGLPNETPQTLKDSIEFGDKLSKMGVQHGFHILAPFPGTEVRDRLSDYDLKILTDDWPQYHANRAIVETSTVTKEMLDNVVLEWEQKYKEHLGKLKTLRETGQGSEEEIWPLTRLEHTVNIYDLMMGRIIEAQGVYEWSKPTGSTSEMIDSLVSRIDGQLKVSSDELRKTLEFAAAQNYLIYAVKDDQIVWQWVDYL